MTQAQRDDVAAKLRATTWRYAESDLPTVSELERRIAERARVGTNGGFITYGELVDGVEFHLPKPRRIDPHAWEDWDRLIIGDYLGCIASQTFQRHGFSASSLVVSKEEFRPSASFFKWMRELGVLRPPDDDEDCWKKCYTAAIEWYQRHPGASAL